MPYYLSQSRVGIIEAAAGNDGYNIAIKWTTAYPTVKTNSIAYNIYYTSNEDKTNILNTIYSEGVKFIVSDGSTSTTITDLTPGQIYWFSVRAVEYDPAVTNISTLVPVIGNLATYPTTLLSADIGINDTIIPVIATSEFPSYGVIKIGIELIRYTSVDVTHSNLVLINSLYRGYNDTPISIHNTDGYDGITVWDPTISLFLGAEERNTKYYEAQCRFDLSHYAYRDDDGYHQRATDITRVDLTSSDQYNVGFASYDYAGWHRTDPVQLLNGECVGSYIGGEQFCADGYSGVGQVLRGLSVQEQNNQRQEMLLSVTAEPVCLIKKSHTGITCSCYLPSSEYPDDRCSDCLGSGFIIGWEQYYNPRRSDGRLMVRFGPTDDKVKIIEAGFEPETFFDCWTLTVPTIKDRDFIVRFDQDNNEEFRYEVINITRNRMLESLMGGQKFRVQRIRKTDPIYQVKVFRDTATLPQQVNTGIASSPGILPHSHIIVMNENGMPPQTTSISTGHNHVVQFAPNGQLVVVPAVGHTHAILL